MKLIQSLFYLTFLLVTGTSCIEKLELNTSKEIKTIKIKAFSSKEIPNELAIEYDSSVRKAIKKYQKTNPTIQFSYVNDTAETANLQYDFNSMRYASGARRFGNFLLFGGSAAFVLGTGFLNYYPFPANFVSKSRLDYQAKGDSINFKRIKKHPKTSFLIPHGFLAGEKKQKVKHLRMLEKYLYTQLENLEYNYVVQSKRAERNAIVDQFHLGKNYVYFNIGFNRKNVSGTSSNDSEIIGGFGMNWGVGYLKQFSRNFAWQIEGNYYSGTDLTIRTKNKEPNGNISTNYQSFESKGISAFAGMVYSPIGVKVKPYFEAAINPVIPISKTIVYKGTESWYKNTTFSTDFSPILCNAVGGVGFAIMPSSNIRSTIGVRYTQGLISYLKNSDIVTSSMQFYASFVFYFGERNY